MSGPVPHAPMPWRFIPWHIEEGPAAVRSNAGWIVCATSSDADAACIVHRVNNWDAVVAELEWAESVLKCFIEGSAQLESLRAALALAKGEQA